MTVCKDETLRASRRRVLTTGAAALAAPFILIPGRARGAGKVVVVNFGGSMGSAKQQAIYTPFTRETGIEVVVVPGPDLAKIRAQVQSRDVEWDVVDLLDAWVPAGARLGLLEPIDEKIVDRSGCIPFARHDFAVGGSIYAGGIAFPTDRLGGKVAMTWPDFWNVAGIPGRRGLRNRVTDTLEIALMGDGVAPKDVYPCDVERAFKALDRIKPAVSHWIAQTAQTVSLIQSNETDFTFTYTTRVKDMQRAGVPMGYSFKQNLLGVGWAGVLKGTPRKEAAMRLCAYIAKKDRQVELANLSVDAPCYVDALAKVDPEARKWMPDVGDPNNLFVNAEWWDTRVDDLTRRFKEWLLA
ncbi:MAG: ABC transporter substrate-binding protein [Rhodospirillales bacterium]|nr:ABC transporter substrate-binding protein [Rhodospirillales bacterium]